MDGHVVNVLVTGVGGNVGQGIIKSLKMSCLRTKIVVTDIDPRSAGLFRGDAGYILPHAKDRFFLERFIDVCESEQIDAVLVGSEAELEVLAKHKEEIETATRAKVIVSTSEVIDISNDKWKTFEFLKSNGFNYPKTVLASDEEGKAELLRQVSFPLVIKPRCGYGAQNVYKVSDKRQMDNMLHEIVGDSAEDYMIQEYLGAGDDEYTSGCFYDMNGQHKGTITMSRQLKAGTTYKAEINDYPDVETEVIRVLNALKPLGPCNVQSRLHNNMIVTFEINARFSGTSVIRAYYGFNEVEASLRHYVLEEADVDLGYRHGVALRYWDEVYLDAADFDLIRRQGFIKKNASKIIDNL